MSSIGSLASFALLVGGVAAAVRVAARRSDPRELPHPAGWTLAGRRLGPGGTAVLLGGTVYTAYTVVAVPGLTYATGGFGLYALAYTVLLQPVALVVLPALRELASRHGLLTAADLALNRHGSHALALAVALTGILAAMPYLVLQVVGLEAVLRVMGIDPQGPAGLLGLAGAFVVLALVLLPGGLRACARFARFKAVLIFGMLAVVLLMATRRTAGPGQVFAEAGRRLSAEGLGSVAPPGSQAAYLTLALGSALAQLMYPQVLTVSFAARSTDALRRAVLSLPLWTAALGLFAYLGFVALALDVRTPDGHAELAVPMLLDRLDAPPVSGLLLGALAIAALLPAAVMAVGIATLVARNIYAEYFNPTATPKHEVRAAGLAAVVIITGALAFALALHPQDAINLHLLGGVWISQTLPAVGLAPFTRWFHHRALLAGWAVGMLAGTALVVSGGFSSVVDVGLGLVHLPVYVAVTALVANLLVALALTPVLDRAGVPRRTEQPEEDRDVQRRGSRFAVRVD
ncbi:sodium:solute symporter [Kitasatospora sp. RG8]|uniref:sodium:solute symporter family protein n=1 Tax=Kitasatospora sp. RG8 TaxID=2820815 RepID=UPI001ADFBCE5|nr:sodium:solute symporter [Kitasatospora sp. RG8]MBP0452915.1 sodium:solute symporter [Kitasatospora sp. RG8]